MQEVEKTSHTETLLPPFTETLKKHGCSDLRAGKTEVFQVNIGYMCNQTCKHCHVDAGPHRTEMMSKKDMQRCLEILSTYPFQSLDITGGAPEMHPHFRWFVTEAAKTGISEIIVRCNLTIIRANPIYHDLPEFFNNNKVRVVSSLPFYNPDRTDRQRGKGVFQKSIQALRMLNEVGYGMENSGLQLDLVYNPGGAYLPASQTLLENDFKKILHKEYGVFFNTLLTINNMPVKRFLDYLHQSGNYEEYMDTLLRAFNPSAIEGLMCRNTISVAWNGKLYDCDFNQMLDLPLAEGSKTIYEYFPEKIENRQIALAEHCYGCTAGTGSGCRGSIVE